jgi:hypothetical protein
MQDWHRFSGSKAFDVSEQDGQFRSDSGRRRAVYPHWAGIPAEDGTRHRFRNKLPW